MAKEKFCKVCGREDKLKNGYCSKHWTQYKEYGFFLDENSRHEPNEIVLHSDCAELLIYDSFLENIDVSVKLDKNEVDKIKNIIWRKTSDSIIGVNLEGKTVSIQNIIMDTLNNKIKHIDGNFLNNRKSNLETIEKEKKVKKINKKDKGKIKITSIGGSTIDVTGSCWSVEYDKDDGTRGLFLIECGGIQGGTVLEDYNANKRMKDAIPFDRAEFIIMGHVHIDHSLLLPTCVNEFQGKIILTDKSAEISQELLKDCAFINDRNAKDLNKKGKKIEPLYTESDCYLTFNKYKVVETNKLIELNSNVSIRFLNNSHCYGANQIEIQIRKPSNHISKIVYTSDLGSKFNLQYQPFVVENEIVKKADMLICESTYGQSYRGFTKDECAKEREDLIKELKNTISTRSRCLIPSFSFQRSQAVMMMLYENLKDYEGLKDTMIIVDSRLTNSINNIFLKTLDGEQKEYWKEIMSWDRFKFITSYKDTEKFLVKRDIPMIIISSSGMLDNGHSKDWTKSILTNQNDKICFIGYCGRNTLGNKIQNTIHKTVSIDGNVYNKKCKIKIYTTFSSHIQQNELIEYFKTINIGKAIILHHGSKEAKLELKEKAMEELSKIGKSTKIIVADKGCDEFTL